VNFLAIIFLNLVISNWRVFAYLANCHTTDSLCLFCTILTSALLSVGHASTIEDTADNMIPHSRQISDPASPDDNRAVLLEVVVNPRYVSRNFFAIGQPDTGDLAQG
jgi:hypothetical protein